MPTKQEIIKFSTMILSLSCEKKLSIMDTLCYYCDKNGFEIEVAATLLTPTVKSKIKIEAQNLNMMKKTARLPV